MGKHNKVSEMDELFAKVDADAKPRVQQFAANIWEIDEFIEKFSSYLRETFEGAYSNSKTVHIEDAAAHTWAAAENLYYAVSNFRK